VRKLGKMLNELIGDAVAAGFKLAPFIGVVCPGVINADGSIERVRRIVPATGKAASLTCPQRWSSYPRDQ
jgi:hypothetical protein